MSITDGGMENPQYTFATPTLITGVSEFSYNCWYPASRVAGYMSASPSDEILSSYTYQRKRLFRLRQLSILDGRPVPIRLPNSALPTSFRGGKD